MSVLRYPLSFSQFGELMAIDPTRIVGVQVDRQASTVTILVEPEDKDEQKPTLDDA